MKPQTTDSAPQVRRPRSLAEATGFLAQAAGEGSIVAGATALQLEWRRGERRSPHLIDVTGVIELAGISARAEHISIGAATRLAELEESRLVADRLPLLTETLGRVAAPGVRRLATLGGNIAGRTGCLIPTLLALGASVEVAAAGEIVAVQLRAWLRAPVRRGDIIVSVLVPTVAVPHRAMHCKIGLRAAFTPSVIGAAGVLFLDSAGRVETARFAVGGGITAPQCLDAATENIVGQTLDSVDWHALRDRLADEIEAPLNSVRSGYYRKVAAANALVAGTRWRKGNRTSVRRRNARAATGSARGACAITR